MKVTKYKIVTYACGNSKKFGPFDVVLCFCPMCGKSAISIEVVEDVSN